MHFWPMVLALAKGLLTSTEIFALTLLFSLPLGLLIALGRMSKVGFVRQLFRIYISIMRGTPLMLQLFFFYFGPYYIFGLSLGKLSLFGVDYRFISVIIGFSLNYAAYFAEIYRAGIESIPIGQYEAANVLGYSKLQTFFKIILPQVVKRISVMEMFTIAKMEAAAHTTMVPFIVAGLFYYVFNFAVAWGMERVEKSLDYYR